MGISWARSAEPPEARKPSRTRAKPRSAAISDRQLGKMPVPHLQGQGLPGLRRAAGPPGFRQGWCRAAAPRRGSPPSAASAICRASATWAPSSRMTFDTFLPDGVGLPEAVRFNLREAYERSLDVRQRAARAGWCCWAAMAAARRTWPPPSPTTASRWADAALFVVVPDLLDHLRAAYRPDQRDGPRRAAGRHPRDAPADPGRPGRTQQHALGAGEALPDPQPPLQQPAADGHHDPTSGWRSLTRASPRAWSIPT